VHLFGLEEDKKGERVCFGGIEIERLSQKDHQSQRALSFANRTISIEFCNSPDKTTRPQRAGHFLFVIPTTDTKQVLIIKKYPDPLLPDS
jgi:hypothetical protein